MMLERAFGGRRVLVTGGAGFVGSALVRRLIESGARVTVLDDLFTGRRDAIPTGAEFIEGSVTDEPLVRDLVKRHTVVFHMAARNIIASTANPRDDFATNIGGALNVLMAARDSNIERVVYTSSASVYGTPRSIPINEDDHLDPLTPYAVSKLAGELGDRVGRERIEVIIFVDRDRARGAVDRGRRRVDHSLDVGVAGGHQNIERPADVGGEIVS